MAAASWERSSCLQQECFENETIFDHLELALQVTKVLLQELRHVDEC